MLILERKGLLYILKHFYANRGPVAPVAQRYHVTSDTLGREFDPGTTAITPRCPDNRRELRVHATTVVVVVAVVIIYSRVQINRKVANPVHMISRPGKVLLVPVHA